MPWLETSKKRAAQKCCMRASKHADGTNYRLRCNLAGPAGLDSTGETKVDPHTAGSDQETKAETAARSRAE